MYVTGLSVQEAARRLGVNQARVRALLKHGGLTGQRIGSRWVVDDDAVRRRLDASASDRGRPLSPKNAWSAAALLDGQTVHWIAGSERSRLAARLARHTIDDVSVYRWWMRKRASAGRYRLAESDIAELLADDAVVAGGISAAASYGLGLSAAAEAEIYVNPRDAARLVDEFFLVESHRGNLIVHVEESGMDWHRRTSQRVKGVTLVPRLVAAVDLLDGDDTRSRSAGDRLLRLALDAFRDGRNRVG